jgi:hypothetical protein
VGDIVRVSGAGAGGWLVQENSGQSIIGSFASYANCYVVTFMTAGRYNYNGFAASADGVRMYAVGGDTTGIYASADSGRTWSAAGLFSGSWKSVACSANGEIVYAIPAGSGAIERSTDGGVNWTAISASANWGSISCSADGSKYFTGNVACSGDGTFLAKLSGGAITVSTNGGLSFDVNVTSPVVVSCLAASSDCTRLVVGGNPGLLWATSNRGAKWTALTATNQYWSSAWMSADGSRLAGAVATVGVNGGLFYSSTSPQPNTISTNSSIGGSRGSAVELQFIGSGLFIPVSSSGLLWSN